MRKCDAGYNAVCEQLAPLTFEQCFKDIFAYIDRIMAIVRPRKLLFMAIGMFSLS